MNPSNETIHFFYLILLLLGITSTSIAAEWSGNLSTEVRGFKNNAPSDQQEDLYSSIAFKPEFFHQWENGQSITFSAFGRASDNNESRTRADIRELYWNYSADAWELRLGIRKIFWGVTESVHLVDIINQTDLVEGFYGEEKLGQPMLNFAWITDLGTTDFFILPGFRERNFSSQDARLRPALPINSNNAVYESSREKQRIDAAVRWSHYFGDWDIGISHFYGTSREPRLVFESGRLVPNYDIINQTGLDLQSTLGSWLWKTEIIRRSSNIKTYYASAIGLEYSFFDLNSTGVDIGLVTEWLYDSREQQATTPFDNDTMFGLRFALNDAQSAEFLAAIIIDNNNKGNIFSLEASRRVGEQFKLSIEANLFQNIDTNTLLASFANDDYAQIELAYYF